MEELFDVIIIGAGIAGIGAANHLVNAGITNIKVIEARNRIGGRIHSDCMGSGGFGDPEHIVEFGAQWIHGDKGNLVYRYAKRHHLLDETATHDEFRGNYYYEDGSKIEEKLLEKVMKLFKEVAEEMIKIYTSNETIVDISCAEYLEKRLPEVMNRICDRDRKLASDIFIALTNILKEDCSDDLRQISLSYNGFEDDFKNVNFVFHKGYRSVLELLMENIASEVISLNTVVRTIDWSKVETSGKIEVHCERLNDSLTFAARYVISTLPLGVLKEKHSTLFYPILPANKISVIEKLGFGKVCKILLYYKEPFWNKGSCGFNLVWQHNTHGRENIGWEKDLFAFKETNDNILIAWVCGEGAQEVECLTVHEVSNVCTKVLRQFLNNQSIPTPCNILCSKWTTDPYTLGAYTFVTVGSCLRDIKELSKPLLCKNGNPVLLFAGEATDSEQYGSTSGALISGIREAKNILRWKNRGCSLV